MKSFKLATAVFIIIAGLGGAYFIVKSNIGGIKLNGEKLNRENLSNNLSNIFANSINKNPIQWIENNFQKNKAENFGDKIKNIGNENQTINLTEFVAQSMFAQMKDFDQKGIDPLSSFNPQSQEGQELIEKAIAKINNPSLLIENYPINDKDLKISSDNSFQKKAIYLEATGKIIYNNSNNLYKNPIKVLESLILGNVSNANKLADTYQNIFNGFLSVEVPSDWLDLHKRYLVLLKKFENLYRGLTIFKQDPIKADLLVQMIPDMADAEYKIQQEYLEKEKILGI